MVREFREREKSVKAIRYLGANLSDVLAFLGNTDWKVTLDYIQLPSRSVAKVGDWIVLSNGRFFPMSTERFDVMYEPIRSDSSRTLADVFGPDATALFLDRIEPPLKKK